MLLLLVACAGPADTGSPTPTDDTATHTDDTGTPTDSGTPAVECPVVLGGDLSPTPAVLDAGLVGGLFWLAGLAPYEAAYYRGRVEARDAALSVETVDETWIATPVDPDWYGRAEITVADPWVAEYDCFGRWKPDSDGALLSGHTTGWQLADDYTYVVAPAAVRWFSFLAGEPGEWHLRAPALTRRVVNAPEGQTTQVEGLVDVDGAGWVLVDYAWGTVSGVPTASGTFTADRVVRFTGATDLDGLTCYTWTADDGGSGEVCEGMD